MNVIIGTPSYDGTTTVWYTNSIIETIRVCPEDIKLFPVFLSYDALIQRARNDLIAMAIEHKTDLMFIDSDMEWTPENIFRLLSYEEDIVGGVVRKKSDTEEMYNVNTQNLKLEKNGLIKVNSIGTGFLKISNKALQALWDASEEYINDGKQCRMCCNVTIVNSELFSEDTSMMRKLRELGYGIFIDPTIDLPHMGSKKFVGNFMDFRNRLQKPRLKIVGE